MVTLSEIKTYLGISGSTYNTFLTEQEAMLSEAIEGYCGRIFTQDDYSQTFYSSDYTSGIETLPLFHYPVSAVTSVKEYDSEGNEVLDIPVASLRLQKPLGYLTYYSEGFFTQGEKLVVEYTAGFATIPGPVKSALYSLIEERYTKKSNGVALSFGSDVQRISIPGTISIDFDYSLQSNDRKVAYGTLLGSYVNILDSYRSERNIVGSGTISYVETV